MKQKSIPPLTLHTRLKDCIFTSLTFTCYDLLAKIVWFNLHFHEVEEYFRIVQLRLFA